MLKTGGEDIEQGALKDMPKAVQVLSEVLSHFEAIQAASAGGPAGFYLQRLAEYAECLFTRFAPFHAGDRVELTVTPEIPPSSGWYTSKHFLVAGERGTVRGVDYSKQRGFTMLVEFDNDSWIPKFGTGAGEPQKVAPGERRLFTFYEQDLQRV